MNTIDTEAVAVRLLDAEARRAELDQLIADLRAQLVDAVETGGAITVGDRVAYTVARGNLRLNKARAAAELPAAVVKAATVPTLDGRKLKSLLPPALYESVCDRGEPYLRAAK